MQISGWGRYPRIEAEGYYLEDPKRLSQFLRGAGPVIVHALGRSYGDSSLQEKVVLTRRFNHILEFKAQQGVVACESGVSLAELIEAFLPRGWFLGTTPGTKYVSVGGAIASDVHGKNHHKAGCFSEGVISFELMLPGGKVVTCSRQKNQELFRATCGGMGLTGIILTARLQLQKVPSAYIREKTFRARNIDQALELFEAQREVNYSVAWIDCLSRGAALGRSLLMSGEFSEDRGLELRGPKQFFVPVEMPGCLLNKLSGELFNQLYYHRVRQPVTERTVPLDEFFYPLDAVQDWNLLYGRRGFTQYQLVLPKEAGARGLRAILERVSLSGQGAFLGTLKLFGPGNRNYLSFPLEGYTLAMDFKITGSLFPWLEELDRVVLDHGGRLYLSKDVRMSAEAFRRGYPQWEKFAQIRAKLGLKEKFNSRQSRRLEI